MPHAHDTCNRSRVPRQPAPGRVTRRSLRQRQSAELRRLRRQRYAQRIWPLGERVEFELVEKLIEHFALDEDTVDHILDRFAGLDPDALRALGANRLPLLPIHSVGVAQ
jgi:hypothetical protein